VILGLIVTKAPASSVSSNALALLDIAVDIFEKGAVINARAQRAIPFLRNFREEAHKVDSDPRRSGPAPSSLLGSSATLKGPDELAIFGGQTRLLNSRILTKYWSEGVRLRDASVTSRVLERPPDLSPDAATTLGESTTVTPPGIDGPFMSMDFSATEQSSSMGHTGLDEVSPAAVEDSLSFWNGQSFQNQFLEFPQDTSFLAGLSLPTGDVPQPGFDTIPNVPGCMDPGPSQYPAQDTSSSSIDADPVAVMELEKHISEPPVYFDMDQQWLDLIRGAGLLDSNLFETNGG